MHSALRFICLAQYSLAMAARYIEEYSNNRMRCQFLCIYIYTHIVFLPYRIVTSKTGKLFEIDDYDGN